MVWALDTLNANRFPYDAVLHQRTSEHKGRSQEKKIQINWLGAGGGIKGAALQKLGDFYFFVGTTEERAIEPLKQNGCPGIPFAPESIENFVSFRN